MQIDYNRLMIYEMPQKYVHDNFCNTTKENCMNIITYPGTKVTLTQYTHYLTMAKTVCSALALEGATRSNPAEKEKFSIG
jgi:hypothetical protein